MIERPTYIYVILHQSLKNHAGALACQTAHAVSEAIRCLPVNQEARAVALVAETSSALELLHLELRKAGVHHAIVREPDPPYSGAATAIGIEPLVDRDAVRPLLAKFALLR